MESLFTLPEPAQLEHDVARILTTQELNGWYFDELAAQQLTSTLQRELEDVSQLLRDRYPFVRSSEFTPKRDNKTRGYVAGASFTKLRDLNPSSRDHIAWILQTHHGITLTNLTATGKPIIDEPTLKEIGTEPAMMFLRILTITKMLGTLNQGVNAYLKLCTTHKRIHHHCSTATQTFRCAHRGPNLGQVPSDERFRKLFLPSPGLLMVGADLSGIELRILAHYLARYDGGRYAKILLDDDIHQVNADKIGISRKLVKTVTYAFLYGAGDEKIGLSYDPQLTTGKAKKKGKEIKEAYIEAIDGLDQLLKAVKATAERGFLKSLDGRKVIVDSAHKALNYLLQSSAAVLAKRWMVINQDHVKELKLNAHQLGFIHDEIQFECHPDHAADLCSSMVLGATEAGEYYKLRVRIDAEAKQGNHWGDTH